MSSINTNLSAMTALQALKSTQSAMNKNQSQISTGLRVGEASHNASYWSISTQMKSDNGALGAVKDSIKQSKAMINTFTSALDKNLTYLNKMKEGLVAASQPGADLAKIQTEFKANIEGMKSAAGSASFNGQNWLAGDSAGGVVKLVTSYDGVSNTVGTLSIDTSKTKLFNDAATGDGGILDKAADIFLASTAATTTKADGTAKATAVFDTTSMELKEGATIKTSDNGAAATTYTITAANVTGGWSSVATSIGATAAFNSTTGALTISGAAATAGQTISSTYSGSDIAASLKEIDKAIAKVTEGSAMLGANKALLETQEEFIGVLSDNLTAGVSAFIDADMNEASTRNQALQTQQQLGVQALSMANQNSQMILKLFQ
jgi:flagellin